MVLACAAAHYGRFRIPERLSEAQAALRARVTIVLTLIGALWGWSPGSTDVRSPSTVICVLSLLAGMSAAALAVFSACLPVAVGFFLPAIVPVWLVFLATGDLDYLPMFLGTPLYLGVLIVFARNYARVARHSIALRFENVDLIHQLREQTARSERAQRAAEEPTAPSPCSRPRPATTCASRCTRSACSSCRWTAPARRAPAPVDRAHPLLLGRRARDAQYPARLLQARRRRGGGAAARLPPAAAAAQLENEFAPQ